jgi:hypothetical protein
MISSNPRQSKNSHQGTVADATEPVELEVRMEGEVRAKKPVEVDYH